jgi:hypothetical protein
MTQAALFLLKHPPLEEIGGSITEVIERYRYHMLTEAEALEILTTKHKKYIQDYVSFNDKLDEIHFV